MTYKAQLSIEYFNADFHLIRTCDKYNIYFRSISNDHSVSIKTPIFRYMKFSHLLSILKTSTLYIAHRSSFSDLRDKSGLSKFIPTERERFEIKPVISFKDKSGQLDIEHYTKKALDLCISCWTMDQTTPDGGIQENYLMWKAYQTSDLMCRIGTTIENLINQIEPTCDILISDVSYVNRGASLVDRVTFNKSKCYAGEREVRLVPLKLGQPFIQLQIQKLDEWLESIVLSPFVTPQIENMLCSYLRTTFPWVKPKIRPSAIMEY